MNSVRFSLRAIACFTWVVLGLVTIALVYWIFGLKFRLWSKKYWSHVLLWICGIRVKISGEPTVRGATLFVANHVSWLDIFVMNYVRATAFIAKSEIRKWPVAGWLATGADTIFIERGSRHAVHAVAKSVHEHFERSQAVGLFPEGTTSEGFDVLPFYANLFEPARKAHAVIQPVALRYFHREKRSGFPAFVGEESLLMNMWRVFGTTGVSVEMVFLPVLTQAGQDAPPRAVLGKTAQASIKAALD